MACCERVESPQEFIELFRKVQAEKQKQTIAVVQSKYPLHSRISEKALAKMYLAENRSARDIAEDYGVAVSSIQRLLRRYGIRKVEA